VINLQGHYKLELVRAGKIIHREQGHNLITTVGENHIAARFIKTAPPVAVDWIALGSGTAAPLKSNTVLQAEIALTRTASSSDVVSVSHSIYVFAVTAVATITVNECGIFNDAVAGTMIARFLTQEFDMQNLDVLNATWDLEFTGVE